MSPRFRDSLCGFSYRVVILIEHLIVFFSAACDRSARCLGREEGERGKVGYALFAATACRQVSESVNCFSGSRDKGRAQLVQTNR